MIATMTKAIDTNSEDADEVPPFMYWSAIGWYFANSSAVRGCVVKPFKPESSRTVLLRRERSFK